MNKLEIFQHPVIIELKDSYLLEVRLSWELCDFIDSVIDHVDSLYLKGLDEYCILEELLNIASPRFLECKANYERLPEHPVIKHNLEVLLLVSMNLLLCSKSRKMAS